jgi:hypothetical protein
MKKFMLRRLGVAHDMGVHKPTLHDCIETVLEQSDSLMDDVLDGLKVILLPSNVKTWQALQTPTGRAAIELLVANSPAMKKSFARALRAVMYGGDAKRIGAQPLVRFDDFQFLEEEQIDANIELAMTQQEVMASVESVLPALNGLVSSLLGWTTVQPHLNPLKPESFVYALRESFQDYLHSEEIRSVLMTACAGLLGSSLASLYKEINAWLRTQGVESVAPAGALGGEFGPYSKPAESSVTRTLLTLDRLRKLLSGELDPNASTGGVKDFTHTVPASFVALEDLKLVEPMMKRLTERANQSAALKQNSQSSAGTNSTVQREQTQSKKLGKQLGEEVVRLMLENLTQDRRLMSGVRMGLKLMEPVLIKLSQGDPRFFSDRQHPARQFMDKITSRSLAFSSEEEPGYARFLKTFDNAVQVLAGGEGDAASFARLLRKLEEGWAKDEQEQRHRAEEAARALLHAEQRNMLAQRLAAQFAERLQGKHVPELVATFLQGPWAQVVAESQLGCIDGTADSDGYLSLVDDLIWSVQLRLARRNRTRLVELVPGMLVRLRQGLGRIAYPTERITDFFDELITLHEKAFEGARPALASDGVNLPAAAQQAQSDQAELSPDAYWMAESEATDSGYFDHSSALLPELPEEPETADPGQEQNWTTDALNTGTWVDLALGREWVRAQLTWVSPHRTLFMFISGSGMAHSMSRRTMDRLRGLGLIHLVSDGRVIDNALDAVAQAALLNDIDKASSER